MSERVVKVSLTAQVTGFLAGMEKARKATEQAGSAAEQAARKVEAQKQAMDSAGKGLMAVGVVAVAATALSVKAAIGWESAWAGVTKTVSGTPAELAKVEEGLRSLAKTLPSTHGEIAGVAEAAGQLGVAQKDVVGFTETMIDLGETTNLTADEAATSIAQISNVMGTMAREGAEGVERFGATLVALGNAGASTEAEILEMAKRIAGAAKLVGASESDVLALANAMASVGIEAQLGGGVMSRVMQRMYGDVMDGGEALETLAGVAGVSAKEFATAFETDPVRAVDLMVNGLGRIKDEGGNVIETMSDLGIKGTEETGVILRLAGAGDLLADSLKLGDEAWESNSALAEEAAKRYATVESQLQIMGNRVTDAAISFGQVFLPAVSAVATAVGEVADALGSMDPALQGLVATVGLMGGAVALAGGVFLLAIPKIAAYQTALVVLSTSSMPGVAGAAAAMMTATTKAGTAMAATRSFIVGPWGAAIAGAALGIGIFVKVLESVQASSAEVENSLLEASTAAELFATASTGKDAKYFLKPGTLDGLKDLDKLLGKAASQASNWWERWDQSDAGSIDTIRTLGKELAGLSGTDLPGAQRAFALMADETDGTDRRLWQLLSTMPEYRQALIDQANQLGINVTSTDEAANKTALLELAMGEAEPVAIKAADAYLAAADEASALADEVLTLIGVINEANGVGQDAVSANAAWRESIEGIAGEVEAQKEAFIQLQRDGYEEANGTLEGFVGTLDGFVLSLDESTASGSANADMLAGVAADAQAAALAQFEVDKTTMSAKDATDKYISTLGLSREELRLQAEANGYSADEVQKLIDKVFALPTQREVEIIADTAAAADAVNRFITNNTGRRIELIVDGVAGRKVVGTDFDVARASGGILPGAPSNVDNMIAHVASGEFVTRASQTAIPANRAALEYINRGGVIKGYSGGGYVSGREVQYVSSGGRGGGSGASAATVQRVSETLNMQVDGRTVATVLRDYERALR